MEFPRTRRLLRARMRRRKRKEKVSKVSKTRITALWAQSFKKYGLPHQPLHSLRHTGPSRDVYIGHRTLFDVKQRGRWGGKEGVERYSKSINICKLSTKESCISNQAKQGFPSRRPACWGGKSQSLLQDPLCESPPSTWTTAPTNPPR